MGEYFIRVVKLPAHVEACVTPNDDGTFSIYINELLPEDARRAAAQHEIDHIMNDHFYSLDPVSKIEKRTSH